MTKKIKNISILLIFAIILAASVSLYIVNGKSIDNVKKCYMDNSSVSTVDLSWKKVKSAGGYKIYLKNDNGDYHLFKEVKEDTNKCVIDGLDSGRVYDLEITAVKEFHKKIYESETPAKITVYTIPDKINAQSKSEDEGLLNVSWKPVKNVNGYELQYSKDKDFKDAKVEKFEDANKKSFEVEKLKPEDTYYTRIRSYIDFNGETIYGDWSDVASIKIAKRVVMSSDIDPKKPMVALSFDDGPAYPDNSGVSSTKRILDVLEKHSARATFFMVGQRINKSNAEYLKREIKLGCEIGSHTYDHNHYGKNVTKNDIIKNTQQIKKQCGQAPTIFRCPGGIMSPIMAAECKAEGMPIAYWSVDTEDWKSRNADEIYKKTMNGVYDGAIILMHDIYPSTADAVERIVPDLIKEGYQIVTVTELLTAKNGNKPPKPGQQYIDYKTINNNT